MRRLLGMVAAAVMGLGGLGAGGAVAGQSAPVQSVPGWEAVGRLNIGGRSMCTASLIAPDLVLTAAHCMYDIRHGRAINPRSITFEAGLNGRSAKAARKVVKAVVHPGYRHGQTALYQTGTDLAVLRLSSPIGAVRPLLLASAPVQGAQVDVMSYSRQHKRSLRRQTSCQVLSARPSSLITSCRVDLGASGSPVLQLLPGRPPRLVSVISSKARMGGRGVSLAAPLGQSLRALMQQAG